MIYGVVLGGVSVFVNDFGNNYRVYDRDGIDSC